MSDEPSPRAAFQALTQSEREQFVFNWVRIVIFEIIWPSFVWIDSVYGSYSDDNLSLYLHYTEQQRENELNDCRRLIDQFFDNSRKMIEVAGSTDFVHGNPSPNRSVPIMNNEIFIRHATEFAPWRLEDGR